MSAKKKDIAAEVDAAKEWIVERALVAYIEDIDGRVPSDAEIEAHMIWARFAQTPLSIYEKGGFSFHDYFVWKRQHALALGFYDAQHPLDLKVVRVPRELWPTALALYVQQYPANPGEFPAAKP